MSAQATPQCMEALTLANALRLEGADIRCELHALPWADSRRRAAELLRNPPDPIAHMRLGHFLAAIRYFGQHKAVRAMHRAGLSSSMWDRRIGPIYDGIDKSGLLTLTERQREALADVLEEGLR